MMDLFFKNFSWYFYSFFLSRWMFTSFSDNWFSFSHFSSRYDHIHLLISHVQSVHFNFFFPWLQCELSLLIVVFRLNRNYYSFKTFPRFWLAKSTRLIHHNQLLMTKFERENDVKNAAFSQVKAPLTERTWGRGWVVLVVNLKKWRTFHSFQE